MPNNRFATDVINRLPKLHGGELPWVKDEWKYHPADRNGRMYLCDCAIETRAQMRGILPMGGYRSNYHDHRRNNSLYYRDFSIRGRV